MAHAHDGAHLHVRAQLSRKLVAATAATALLIVAELIAGWHAGSLALIGDAFHNFTDALALVMTWTAVRLERRPATGEKSFGYHRAGILAAFINGGTLLALTIFLAVEAVRRFRAPHAVASGEMMIVAAAALVINAVITFALRRESADDVNVRSAVVHMFGDAVSSLGTIGAALLIRQTGAPQWDAVVTLLIAALIVWSSWGVLRESVNLLLEGTPTGIDPTAVIRSLAAVDGIRGVHHLHIWALGPSRPALSCHLMVGDVPVRSTSALLAQITEMLERDYRIVHTTVQFEFAACGDDDIYCLPYPAELR